MLRPRTLIFHPALAPYRVDLFNRLKHALDIRVVFLSDHVPYYRELNQYSLRNSLKCQHDYLIRGFRFRERDFRIGLGRIIREWAPEVVVSHEFSYATLYIMFYRKCLAKRAFGHVLWTAENIHMLGSRRGLQKAIRLLCSRAVDSLLVYSQQIKDGFATLGVLSEKMFICANHQDEESFWKKLEAASPLAEECIRKHNLEGKKVVLFVGRLTAVKNLDCLLEAFAQVSQKVSQALLTLVGTGPKKKNLELLASHLGIADRVLFLGHREGPQVHVWYLLGALLVLPSTWEPYGAVVNEALLSGSPVICSSRAGASVLVREGKNGGVFDPYDGKTLARLMQRILVDTPGLATTGQFRQESLMPVPFNRDVTSFIQAVEHAACVSAGKGRYSLKKRSCIIL